ncbi:MAG: hypothetical protein GXX78_11385, partial [Bacteroidales bacterium]|nr:hypothetical protein [Bacteroidales bacterium]
ISLHNINGQRLALKENQILENGSMVELEIGLTGVYFLTISTPQETRSFKATGAKAMGSLNIATQTGAPVPLKSGPVYTLTGSGTEKGDNVKVSVFKEGYIAQPVEMIANENKTLVFPLKAQTAPEVETLEATNIQYNSATLNGNVITDGNSPITERGFYWSSTNNNPGIGDNKIVVEGTIGSYSAELSGLEHATYYVRAYATNIQGTAYGNVVQFITSQSQTVPAVTTTSISSITQTTATSGGNVTIDGGSAITARGVCWNTTSNPTIADNKSATGTGTGTFTSDITGLTANTTYYVRAYATNSKGTGYGNVVQFKTRQELTLPTITTDNASNITQTNATGGGNVTSDGGAFVIARGICWNTTGSPTIFNNKTTEGLGTGTFTSNITGLIANTTYCVRAYATNSQGTAYGEQKSFTTSGFISLCNALDNCNLSFTHSGNAEWFPQTAVSYFGGSSAQSGQISHNQESTLNTIVTGPGAISFYWKVSSESDYDKLKFYIGNTLKDSISGNVDWQLKEFIIPEGNHTITWNYVKDQYASNGEDCGRIDKIVLTIGDSTKPTLPTVTTATNKKNTNIGSTSASFGGEVTFSGFASVTARGVCWNTAGNPTIADNIISNGSGIGAFTSIITGLTVNTTYYVRAYATNRKGIAYGQQVEFITNNNNDGKDIQTAIVDVTNPATGKTWMDRNLGASRPATSRPDSLAHGDLYQWGRAADGHQKRNSLRTSMISYTDVPEHGYYISSNEYSDGNWVIPRNNNFWQGVNGVNNPCPRGYRLPTQAEWDAERLSWVSNNEDGAFNSPLKLTPANDRQSGGTGSFGSYWSSTAESTTSKHLFFNNSSANTANKYRYYGLSVRCIKDSETSVSTPSLSTTYITNITQTTATSGGDIVSDGGATVNLRGVCWNTTGNPSILDNKTSDGPKSGRWVSAIVGLQPNTTYYVRAYATNNVGTAYGEQISFTTLDKGEEWGQRDTQTAVVDVINPASGITWMDRNLGASRAATSSTDAEAYGDLYQWGRAADGHQKRNSPTTPTVSSTDTPGHGNFIYSSGWDWRSPKNTNLWQGVNGFNNPCPVGYRLPTAEEWEFERLSWDSQNVAGAFASPLKLPLAGGRYFNGSLLTEVGRTGYYWSDASQGSERNLEISSGYATIGSFDRKDGLSVRCLKHTETIPTVITTNTTHITKATAISGGNVTAYGGFIVTARGVCWNTTGNPTIADSKTINGTGAGTFTSSITGLKDNTTYYVRAYATNSKGTAYGDEKSFIASEPMPLCEALENCNLTFTHSGNADWFSLTTESYYGESAAQSGQISNNQQSTLETTVTGPGNLSFYWKVSSVSGSDKLNFYIGTTQKDKISGIIDWQLVEYVIPEGNHTLKWCYEKDYYGSYGEDCGWLDKIVFKTIEQTLPTMTTTNITNINPTTATGGGNITSDGFAAITTRGICWNTSGNPTIANNKTTNGSGAGSFTSGISGLSENTTYFVRAYATNSKGTAYGPQVSFKTRSRQEASFTDPRDGNTYLTVSIGNQIWMAENLKYLPNVVGPTVWSDEVPYFYVYDYYGNNVAEAKATDNYATYGVLYNWPAAMAGSSSSKTNPSNIQGACPSGWHMPSDAEWVQLITYLGGDSIAGDKLKESASKLWYGQNEGATNETGFSALPGGERRLDETFIHIGSYGKWWSTTTSQAAPSVVWNRFMVTGSSNVERLDMNKYYGYSVRCIKNDETKASLPRITTISTTNISQTSVTSGGNVTSDGGSSVTERGICWNTTGTPTITDNKSSTGTGTGTFTSNITGLTANTAYYVRAYATNTKGTGYGNLVQLKTSQGLTVPSVTTTKTSNITQTTATSGGNVTSDGGSSVTARGVCWNTTGNPTIDDSKTTNGSGAGTFTSNITGLTANTTYYIRAYAINSKGTSYGDVVQFKTSQELTVPSITTTNASNITQTTATSGGNVTSDGGANVAARGVCWNTTGDPTVFDKITSNGTGVGTYTTKMTGLTANTTYYVRAYAANSQGTSYGEQVIFKTLNEDEEWWQRDTLTVVVDVYNPATGKTWMDRNLGANSASASSTDTEAYGDLYQWGRAADGHQKRNSTTTSTLSSTDTPGHRKFILAPNDPYDWRSTQNDNLWQSINDGNNPCPSGYRLPTEAEWITERKSWSSSNAAGAFASSLKLPMGGYRYYGNGLFYYLGSTGYYWSSTVDGVSSRYLFFNSSFSVTIKDYRTDGCSVRCIKD